MDTGLISTRYATALLDYAMELDQQDEVYEQMKVLSQMFRMVKKLRNTLLNPSISKKGKKKIIMKACGGKTALSLEKTIELILRNDREEQLQYIALRFIDLYRKRHNITDGKLVTAVAIDENTKQRLIGLMEEKLHEDIELEFTTDPKILGGFVLQIDGSQWDASISRQLNQVRNKFKEINKKIGS